MNLVPWKKNKQELSTERQAPLSQLRWEMDQLFDRFFSDPFSLLTKDVSRAFGDWTPSIDVTESNTEVAVKIEVPGVAPENVNVSLNGNVLTVEGEKSAEREEEGKNYYRAERSFGSFRRSVELPQNVDLDSAAAEHTNGVLTVRLTKRKGSEAKRIPITTVKG
jgi:HSP20 family protein